jgi:hypothetical protein
MLRNILPSKPIRSEPIRRKSLNYTLVILVWLLCFNSCSMFKKASYDPDGHQYASTLQEKTPLLIDKAINSFYKHKQEALDLMTIVEKAYEYAREQKKNETIAGIWDALRDPKGNRLGKFVHLWQLEGKLSKEIIAAHKKWISADIKLLVELEEAKKK